MGYRIFSWKRQEIFYRENYFLKMETGMGDNRRGDIEQHGGRAIDPDSLSPAEILERARLSYAQEGRESPRVRQARLLAETMKYQQEHPPTELPPDIPRAPPPRPS